MLSINKLTVLRTIVILVCTSGLLYQSITHLVKYVQYSTVVSLKQKHLMGQNLPAITICYDIFFSYDRMKHWNGTKKDTIHKYLAELDKHDGLEWTNANHRIYMDFLISIPAYDLIDKLSLEFEQLSSEELNGTDASRYWHIHFKGYNKSLPESMRSHQSRYIEHKPYQPIESFYWIGATQVKWPDSFS